MTPPQPPEPLTQERYVWRVGDVFTNGEYYWKVESVVGERAVLRSCSTSWASTRPLTFEEWHEGGRWKLSSGPATAPTEGK